MSNARKLQSKCLYLLKREREREGENGVSKDTVFGRLPVVDVMYQSLRDFYVPTASVELYVASTEMKVVKWPSLAPATTPYTARP